MKSCFSSLLLLLLIGADAAPYRADFQKAEIGSTPADLLVLNGNFTVKEAGENRFLELPGEPLDSFGFLVGPEEGASLISARIFADVSGKRNPEFGVGLAGAGGYKLWVWPAMKQVQINRGDVSRATIPYEWTPGTWTRLRLQMSKTNAGTIRLDGKIWTDGTPEPKEWTISAQDSEMPPMGRASVWGIPYSGKAMRFDDIEGKR